MDTKYVIKHKHPVQPRTVCLLLFILLNLINLQSQNRMFIDQIEGRTIVREHFDENNIFKGQQIFKAGGIIEKDGNYEIKVVTELFDENKKSKNKYETTYKCKPDKLSVVVFVFPFSNPKYKESEITSKSKNFKGLYDIKNLANVKLNIDLRSGLMSLLGSKSIINIYDRESKIINDIINIKSKISIKAYALGIRIKQLNYSLIEKLNTEGLLSYQKFTEEDGSYFTMNYK